MNDAAAPNGAEYPASSTYADSWGSGGNAEDLDIDHEETQWEQDSEGALVIPKVEADEDIPLDQVKPVPTNDSTASPAKVKRPRGRPRKHPLVSVVSATKVTKGRSKTGCITCRKRKKKCDEAKPRCMNCEKNAVVCEGYHEKQVWRSGKERAEQERIEQTASITNFPLFHGVETTEDRIFWKHYVSKLSNLLTVEGESRNAFKDIILHLANRHQGLMHSILSISSKHIDWDAPYGKKMLDENPTNLFALQERSVHHHDEAMKRFWEDMSHTVDRNDPHYESEEYQTTLCARYGQIMCRVLQTRIEGNNSGEHRLHLKGYQALIADSPPLDPTFYTFITEFFQYHIYADDLLWHPDTSPERLSSEDWRPIAPIQPQRLVGVSDGLLHWLAVVSGLRVVIRQNMIMGTTEPPVDYMMLFRAAEINSAIQEWQPEWPATDSRHRICLLYKQTMFIYLFRTIYPPSATPQSTVSGLSSTPSSSSSTPQRRASMAASVVSTASAPMSSSTYNSYPPHRGPTRHSSMHEYDSRGYASSRGSSPQHKKRAVLDDPRLISAVDESLSLLESFGPSDPAQTLLLIPCMLVGVACFDPERRERLRKALRAVRGYTGMRNCDRILELLGGVWALMDDSEWVAVWDWQAVARRMGVDVLCA